MSFANVQAEPKKQATNNKSSNNNNPSTDNIHGNNDLDYVIRKTSGQIQLFSSLIRQFDNQRKLIGSKRDCKHVRDNVDSLRSKISDLEVAIRLLMDNLASSIDNKLCSTQAAQKNSQEVQVQVHRKHVVLKERLSEEFKELCYELKRSVDSYNEAKERVPFHANVEKSAPTERTPLVASQSNGGQIQTQELINDNIDETDLQYHMLLTQERNRDIQRINDGILEVNSIFKDIGKLVHQQGQQLDTVEDNILQIHGNSQGADRELVKAQEYQKKKGKWSCILLVALCIFVLIIVLGILS